MNSNSFPSILPGSTVLAQSVAGNNYLLSNLVKEILFIHPVLRFIIEKQNQGLDIPSWLDSINDPIEIRTDLKVGKEDIHYYYKYMQFLKASGYFGTIEKRNLKEKVLTPDMVENAFSGSGRIAFEVTEDCNLECSYCGLGELYYQDTPRTGKHLSFDTAKAVIDYFREKQEAIRKSSIYKELTFSFYGGEPLLNFPLITSLVKYIQALEWKNRRITFHLTTNGVLLVKYMDFLVQNDFTLVISLDGNREQNRFRVMKNGNESFGSVVSGIVALKNKYHEYFQKKVRFNSVLHSKNSVSETSKFFQCMFEKNPFFLALNPIGVRSDRAEDFGRILPVESNGSGNANVHNEQPGKIEISSLVSGYTNNYVNRYSQLLTDHKKKRLVNIGTCNPFEQKIFCTARGDLLPCDKISPKYALGKVLGGKVIIDYAGVANTYNRWYRHLSQMCDRCYKGPYCANCMFFIPFDSDQPSCDDYCNSESYRSHLENVLSTLELDPGQYIELLKN